MKHAYFLIFVVQLVSAFPNLISEEGSTESIDLSCNDIHDCIKIDENMHCFIDKVRILRILSYLISYFKQKFCLFLAQTRSSRNLFLQGWFYLEPSLLWAKSAFWVPKPNRVNIQTKSQRSGHIYFHYHWYYCACHHCHYLFGIVLYGLKLTCCL